MSESHTEFAPDQFDGSTERELIPFRLPTEATIA